VGRWYLLGSRWRRLVWIGERFATLTAPQGGYAARRYVRLEELADAPQTDHPAFLDRP